MNYLNNLLGLNNILCRLREKTMKKVHVFFLQNACFFLECGNLYFWEFACSCHNFWHHERSNSQRGSFESLYLALSKSSFILKKHWAHKKWEHCEKCHLPDKIYTGDKKNAVTMHFLVRHHLRKKILPFRDAVTYRTIFFFFTGWFFIDVFSLKMWWKSHTCNSN